MDPAAAICNSIAQPAFDELGSEELQNADLHDIFDKVKITPDDWVEANQKKKCQRLGIQYEPGKEDAASSSSSSGFPLFCCHCGKDPRGGEGNAAAAAAAVPLVPTPPPQGVLVPIQDGPSGSSGGARLFSQPAFRI